MENSSLLELFVNALLSIRPHGKANFLAGDVIPYFCNIWNYLTKPNNQLLALVSFVFRDKILKQIHTLKC